MSEVRRSDEEPLRSPNKWTPPPLQASGETLLEIDVPPEPARGVKWPAIVIAAVVIALIAAANWNNWHSRLPWQKREKPAAEETNHASSGSTKAEPVTMPKENISEPSRAIPFHGIISSVNRDGRTFALGENENARVVNITSRTSITKNNAPATMNDLTANDEVRGSYWKNNDGSLEAKTIRADSLSRDARSAPDSKNQDIRQVDLQKLAYQEAVAIMRKSWPQEMPTNFTAQPLFGDLTGDGADEAVMIIRYRFSGEASTSSFSHVLVYGMRNGVPTLLATLEGGDRAHGGVESVTIENHQLFLNRYRPATEASCMACYDFIETTEYRWEADKFISQNVSLKKLEKRQPAKPASVDNESFRPDKQYPNATRSGTAGFVVSPYPPHNLIDARGFSSGQYVRDPSTGKIFCVPP